MKKTTKNVAIRFITTPSLLLISNFHSTLSPSILFEVSVQKYFIMIITKNIFNRHLFFFIKHLVFINELTFSFLCIEKEGRHFSSQTRIGIFAVRISKMPIY